MVGRLRLLVLVAVIAFCAVYGGYLKGIIDEGQWGWLALMFVWPFALAWIVGSEADRADFYKLKDWVLRKLRIR